MPEISTDFSSTKISAPQKATLDTNVLAQSFPRYLCLNLCLAGVLPGGVLRFDLGGM